MAKTDKSQVMTEEALEAFFSAAREDTPDPSEALMAAILADADSHQPGLADIVQPAVKPTRRGPMQALLSAIGGWPAAAGMATATVAGLWIGFAQPVQLELLSGGLVLSGSYVDGQAEYALEDMTPSYLSAGLFAEDEG